MTDYYCFRKESPTQTNLATFLSQIGWTATRIPRRAKVSDAWLDFPIAISETLEYKHRLAKFCQQHGLSDLIPLTYCLDEDNWQTILGLVDKESWGRFILKPALLNNGQNIHIFENPETLYDYYVSRKRLGGPHVLQRYIEPPHLIQGPTHGHKYSIRQLMVLSTHAGCGIFPNGYLNIALRPYADVTQDLSVHLTNEHLSDERINVVQRLSSEMVIYQPFEDPIIHACQRLSDALRHSFQEHFQDEKPRIGCFGVDFMVDANETLWLLEINHGPCFPVDAAHPLYEKLYTPFWQAVINQFIVGKPSRFIAI
ncbi:tubulin-tyrosine ligase [Legionella sp. W05-934-2]|uniref:tubulin-tyrosine ligase n=1 Tax=Legionella sp. W05-934-2 TaxID=1198649 RepID=UPI003463284B